MDQAVRKKILLVEDEPVTAKAVQGLLENAGYETFWAGNGNSAIEYVKKKPGISLVLMDVDLGESLNGAETAKQLLSMQDVPIVFHSAHSEKEFISAVESVASYGYVLKGSGEYVLLSSIQMAFQLHQLHESIRQSAKRLEAVLNNVNDVIFSVTPEGKFTYISANWPEYFALETDTLIGKGFQDLIHEDDLESALDFYNRLLETRSKTVSEPARVLHPDGTWHYFQCSASPILDEQGNVTEVVGVTRDETDKVNEQKRSHRLSSERDRLLAEEQIRIYNEMSRIQDMVMDRDFFLTDTGALTALEDTRQRVRSVIEIHRKIYFDYLTDDRDFAHYLNNVIQDTLTANDCEAEVQFIKNIGEPSIGKEYRHIVAIILTELMKNSLKHGFRAMDYGRLMVSVTEEQQLLEICVDDNGAGIECIYAGISAGKSVPVQQIPDARLGLKLVQLFTEMYNGTAYAEKSLFASQLNTGTRFMVHIPVLSLK